MHEPYLGRMSDEVGEADQGKEDGVYQAFAAGAKYGSPEAKRASLSSSGEKIFKSLATQM